MTVPTPSACALVPSHRLHGDARRATQCTGCVFGGKDLGPLGRRSSTLGRFGLFTRLPLLGLNGIAARRPSHSDPCPRQTHNLSNFISADVLRPSPVEPRCLSGLVVPGLPSLKYALHLGRITSQRWIQHTARSTNEGARAAPEALLEPAKS